MEGTGCQERTLFTFQSHHSSNLQCDKNHFLMTFKVGMQSKNSLLVANTVCCFATDRIYRCYINIAAAWVTGIPI